MQTIETITTLYLQTRQQSLQLIEGLSEADCQLQSMPDASPAKWHLAHTTWFFETFILLKHTVPYRAFHPQYNVLFNSYYHAIGQQFTRSERGLLSRPSLNEIIEYRQHVDHHIELLLQQGQLSLPILQLIELGIQHEKQHQELLLTDIKHALFQNPLLPSFSSDAIELNAPHIDSVHPLHWSAIEEGLYTLGNNGDAFCFDNEMPTHKHYCQGFQITNRLISNGEFQAFIDDGGYQNPLLWHSDGWSHLQSQQLESPLYWIYQGEQWLEFTLNGLKPLDKAQPVCHVNFYEAAAFALWCGKRLPTEFEWEIASSTDTSKAQFLNPQSLQPQQKSLTTLHSMMGTCWEWTNSAYLPYPGFKPFPGDAGEYNGKFMSGQFVLRGGSCFSPEHHIRTTYRNFFYPHQSWQMSGIRLAEDKT